MKDSKNKFSFSGLTAEQKKIAAMVALLLVGLLLWGRLLIKQVPKTAVADPPLTPLVTAGGTPNKSTTAKKVIRISFPEKLARNPFVPVGYSPTKNPETVIAPVEKSSLQPADDNLRTQAVLTHAEKLTLQSTIQGDHPQAVINGQRVKVGQTIDGFELLDVKPRQVILRMNGVDVRLEM